MTVKIEGNAAHDEVWIFGFGSLIWKAGQCYTLSGFAHHCYQSTYTQSYAQPIRRI